MNYIFSTGRVEVLGSPTGRRFLIIAADDFMADKFQETLREIMTTPPPSRPSVDEGDFSRLERYCKGGTAYSGPPPVIPIPRRPPELAPDEVPRVVAKARAVAIFGPKRGRWK